jgi:hypothetical protein
MIRNFLRFFLFALSFRIVEEGGGGGSPVDSPAAPSDVSSAGGEVAAPVTAPAPAPTMFDAINAHFDGRTAEAEPAPGQPRDPLGRFAHKDANGTPIPAPVVAPAVAGAPVVPAAVKPPVVPGAPATPDDLAMPEGLQPKAQERFQRMADTIKTTAAERDEARGQVNYVRETFQKNGIKQEQFEQAASVIGMLNQGNYQGALQVLDEQRRQIALLTGQSLPGVDALSDHPDLRQAVDQMQVTESVAMELARNRTAQAHQQQQQAQAQQAQQAQQAERQQVDTALNDVDALCKQLAATDIDFPAIEAQLLPAAQALFGSLPPNQWKNAVQAQYSLLKRTASMARGSNLSTGGAVLRPTGQAAPGTAPKTMHDAMWGPKG